MFNTHMKKSIFFVITILTGLSSILFIPSCKNRTGASPKTGAAYNQRRPGSLEVSRKTKPAPGPGLVHIEGGTFVMGGSNIDDIGYDYAAPKRRVTVATFYMDETEVSNVDWLEYLNWTLQVAKDNRWYYEALPDTLVWRSPLGYNEPYVNNYLRHPAYREYPVVGVTWEQAMSYCEWRTNVVNENVLRTKGIMNDWKSYSASTGTAKGGKTGKGADRGTAANTQPFDLDLYLQGQYNDIGKGASRDLSAQESAAAGKKGGKADKGRRARVEDGIMTPGRYRLPTEAEWEYAALSLIGDMSASNINDNKIYPWYGLGVRSPKKGVRGQIYANFKLGAGDNMGVAGYLNDGADITAPVKKYLPNDFGLYNMSGNVNEWVLDTYRQLSFDEVEDFSPFRGNNFKNNVYDEQGKIQTIGQSNVPMKEAAKSGKKEEYANQMAKFPSQSELSPATPEAKDTLMAKQKITFKPDQRGALNPENLDLYGKITMVSNRSKIFKGGSWNDRAYWLNPGTRRFLDQAESTSDIGFRCAMSSVGDPQIDPRSTPKFKKQRSKVGR